MIPIITLSSAALPSVSPLLSEMHGDRLALPQLTICAISSVNISATLHALETSLAQIEVTSCKFFTDANVTACHPSITIVPIARLTSSASYSDFLMTRLVDHIDTAHCLIVQWDGHVLDAKQWLPEFLEYDYIGASWPQFIDGHDVGNGGFSLRSRRLMSACRNPAFRPSHPEDLAIGRFNRNWLESIGMRFAPRELADVFSAERAGYVSASFGYHGVWLMPRALGNNAFWNVYRTLDDHSTVRRDFTKILREIWGSEGGVIRSLRMVSDRFRRIR